jgi:hypothetical protein
MHFNMSFFTVILASIATQGEAAGIRLFDIPASGDNPACAGTA